MKKLLFIINPQSGRGILRDSLMECLDIFCKAGFETTVYLTQGAKDACRMAQENAARFDRIVTAGGDGTLDEVVNGLMQCEHRPPLGYIPTGTTNDFGNSLSISHYPEDAARIAASGTPFPLDIGRFNERYFTYIAAFGAFTSVSYQTPQPNKNLLGHAAYVLEGIRTLPFIKSYHVRAEQKNSNVEGEFIYGMVTNATTVGGLINVSARNVEMDDGLFEVLLVRQPENPMQLQGIINLLLAQKMDSDMLWHCKTDSIQFFMNDEVPWTLDGEYGGSPQVVEIENKTRAISILVKNL